MKKLDELVDVDNGYAFKSSKYTDNGIRVIRITNVQKGAIVDENPKYYPLETKKELSRYLINSGDILMSLTGNVGRVGLFPQELLPAYLNQRVCRLRLKSNEVDKKYLYYLLNSDKFEHDANANAAGIAQLNLSTKWVKGYKIPLPPLPIQRRIAAILDQADALRRKDADLLARYDALAQSVFLEMFGDPVRNEKGWEKVRLGELGVWRSGGTPPRKNPHYFNGNIPWLSSGELNQMRVSNSEEKISQEAISETSAKLVKKGSLLLGMYDTAALKSSIAMKDLSCNQAIAFSLLNPNLTNTIYVYWSVQIRRGYYMRLQRGVRQKNLNLSLIKKIEILNPPLELQNLFAVQLENIERQKQIVLEQQKQSEALFQSLLQKAFKGELVSAETLNEIS